MGWLDELLRDLTSDDEAIQSEAPAFAADARLCTATGRFPAAGEDEASRN